MISIIHPLLISFLLLLPLASTATVVLENGEGTPETQDAAVYPNPAQDFVYVRTDRIPFSLPSGAELIIKVVDILGNPLKVEAEPVNTVTYRIDVSQYPSGYYLLIVDCDSCSGAEKKFFRFLKQ